jgi:hypothetical protein
MEVWMRNDTDKIEIENVNSPGHVERVDRAKYVAMKEALLSVLPKTSPGLTVAEAKGVIQRENTKPLRLRLST